MGKEILVAYLKRYWDVCLEQQTNYDNLGNDIEHPGRFSNLSPSEYT
jgi:hypothetical protein